MQIRMFGGRLKIGKDLSPYVGQTDNFFGFSQSIRYGVDYRTRNRLKAYKNVVYGCTSLIGEALGGYRPYLEKKTGDVWERVDHEFMDLIRQPQGNNDPMTTESFSSFDLFEATGIFQVLQGDAYWYLAKGNQSGKPREIVLLRADKVGVDIDRDTGRIAGYFIRQATGDPIPLEIGEVLRFKLFNPEDPYKGMSVVQASNDYILTDENTAKFTNEFFKNGAAIGGVLSVKGEVTAGAFKKFVRAFREKYQGVDNAGKVAIIRDTDAEFTKIGLGLDELSMADLRKMSLADVAMMFKVPLELLGKITDGTGFGRANMEALEYNFARWNIDIKMQRFDSVVQFALLRYYGLDSSQYRVRHENIIPEDKEYELNKLDKGVDRWISRNEARSKDEAPSVDGGDTLFVPAMNLPLEEAAAATPATDTSTSSGLRVTLVKGQKKK